MNYCLQMLRSSWYPSNLSKLPILVNLFRKKAYVPIVVIVWPWIWFHILSTWEFHSVLDLRFTWSTWTRIFPPTQHLLSTGFFLLQHSASWVSHWSMDHTFLCWPWGWQFGVPFLHVAFFLEFKLSESGRVRENQNRRCYIFASYIRLVTLQTIVFLVLNVWITKYCIVFFERW